MSLPPLVVSVRNPRLVGQFQNSADLLFVADVKLHRRDVQTRIFEDVMFVESEDENRTIAFIYGIEKESGEPTAIPTLLPRDAGKTQQQFIHVLRHETSVDSASLGMLASLFTGRAYRTEAKVTAAYIVAREKDHDIAVGFHNDEGVYELIVAPDTDDLLDMARATLPFDEIG